MTKRKYSKKRRNPIKGKKTTSKPGVVEEANVEELVETNQLLTKANNLLESSTSSTEKLKKLSFQRTQYYPQDSDLLIYPSCWMCFVGVSKLLDNKYS